MKSIIHDHFKGFIGVTVLAVCTILFISSNELIAKMLPDAGELTYVSSMTEEQSSFAYTGEEIRPSFSEIVFQDKEENEIKFVMDDIEVVQYMNNVEIGYADIEVELEGYRNSIILEDVFEIVLGQVPNVRVSDESEDSVFLLWDRVEGADGYLVKKSIDNGKTFQNVKEVSANSLMLYKDDEIEANAMYFYRVAAFKNMDTTVQGEISESVRYVSPLETPVMEGIEVLSNDSMELEWSLVDGAASYQVFRSETEDGAFTLLAEITEADCNTFTDESCEIGKAYYYYVTAGQQIDDEVIYGKASNVLSEKTNLDQAKLSGDTNSDKTGVTLSWREVDDADGYEIYRSKGSNYRLVETIEDGTFSWKDTELDAEEEYTYKVRAYVMIDGEKVYGEYSKTYTKPRKINYNYSGSGNASDITAYAGYPYQWGGKSTSGWDCSGFTYWIMQNVYGVNISTSTGGQAAGGRSVSVSDRSQWQVGDILVYKKGGSVNHVSMYIGNGQMIHALNEKYDTHIQSVDQYESWDDNNLYAVRRYL